MGASNGGAGEARRAGEVRSGRGLTTTVVPVVGMTCRTCENRIERHVRRLRGVEDVSASAVHARVEIVSSRPIPARLIAAAIDAAGYEVGRTPWIERDAQVWATAGIGIAVIALVAIVAQLTGLTKLAAGVGDLSSGGLVVALLLGLAAGVSTCMALVGGLVLALSAAFTSRQPDGQAAGFLDHMHPSLVFMAGRIGGYAFFGALLGALGASVAMPTALTAVLMLAVAVVMTILGTRLTGLSPRIAAWSPTLPGGLGRSLGLDGTSVASYSDARAAGLGAASFFLPCGFTQAVQVYALSTGSPMRAAAIMAMFALGTAPGLLAMAGLPVLVPSRARPVLLRLVGVVVLGFAVINGSAGVRLASASLPTALAASVGSAPAANGASAANAQDLHTYQDSSGYRPSNVTISAGIPTRWNIESLDTSSCAMFLRVPSLGLAVTLHKGSNIVNLPALQAGTLSYTCAMGMYGGSVTVVDRPVGAIGGATP